MGNTAQHCRLGLFRGSDFAGDLEDSKSTSGGVLCIFGSRTLAPFSWMCKKQTAVSHSFTESEIISLDAGLRATLHSKTKAQKVKRRQKVDPLSDVDHVPTQHTFFSKCVSVVHF